MKRYPRLSNRKPENTSITRSSAFNRANEEEFFNNYASVQATCNFSPDRIWNTDETGITTVLQAPRVIEETGTKAVGQSVSAERGSLVTICGIISAVGASIPPLYIFPRVRMKDQFLYGAVPGAVGYAEKSGWMSTRVFLKLLEHIQKHTNSGLSNKILLLMDNHETHVSIDAILYAREQGIVLLSFPPHCTHKM
ncbi:MFS-type transporter clz9-like [Harmonia axyridis]|uniref:MFS-type transporter clz9-like n=1 Tax=Harmonia axyridis TaxID=115357 RepID=UPI001E279097|nr:MFS-type transporter clz9-like [Harmonia axyridis]